MAEALFDTPWLGPLLWVALYISDYLMTLTCARMYQAQQTIVFEGSYEITPLFQADVNALRRVSPRFLIALLASTSYLVIMQRTSSAAGSESLYAVVLGALLLVQAAVHMRHFRNWSLFRDVKSLEGRLTYPRVRMLRTSALELLGFAVLYMALFLVTGHLFVLGGALACAALSLNHYRLARRHPSAAPSNAPLSSA